jgi:hypothetical protein
MAGDGELRRLFQTFMKLKRSCRLAEVNFNSDRGVCQVTLKVTTPGTEFQSPCSGGAQSMSPERKSSGVRNPPTPPAVAAPAPAPAPGPTPAPAPGPAPRRVRKRGPGALLRDGGGGWLGSSQASSGRRSRLRTDPPSLAPPSLAQPPSPLHWTPARGPPPSSRPPGRRPPSPTAPPPPPSSPPAPWPPGNEPQPARAPDPSSSCRPGRR